MATTTTPVAPLILPSTLEFSRGPISVADPDGSQVPSYAVPTGGVQMLQIGCTCTVANAGCQLAVYFLSSTGAPMAVMNVGFNTYGAADWGPVWTGQPSGPSTWTPLAGAKSVAIRIFNLSGGGAWTIYGALQ